VPALRSKGVYVDL